MVCAIIFAIHKCVVADGEVWPVLHEAQTASWVLTIIASPRVQMPSLVAQPLLHVYRAENCNVLGGLASSALVLVAIVGLQVFDDTPSTLCLH